MSVKRHIQYTPDWCMYWPRLFKQESAEERDLKTRACIHSSSRRTACMGCSCLLHSYVYFYFLILVLGLISTFSALLKSVKQPTIITSVYGKVNERTMLESQTSFKSVNTSLLRRPLWICGQVSSFSDGKTCRLSLPIMDSTIRRVSASNSAKLYEMALSNHKYLARGEWQFISQLNTDHVWDSVIVLALLRDKQSNNSHLEVPHEGKQKNRFTLAMEERNKRIIHEG